MGDALGDLMYTKYAYGTKVAALRAVQLAAPTILNIITIPLMASGLGAVSIGLNIAIRTISPVLVHYTLGKFFGKYLGDDLNKKEPDQQIKLEYVINQTANISNINQNNVLNINITNVIKKNDIDPEQIIKNTVTETFNKLAGYVDVPKDVENSILEKDRNLILTLYPLAIKITRIFGLDQLSQRKVGTEGILPIIPTKSQFNETGELVIDLIVTLDEMFKSSNGYKISKKDMKEMSYIIKAADLYIKERLIRTGETSKRPNFFSIDITINQIAEIKAGNGGKTKEQKKEITDENLLKEEKKVKEEEKEKRKLSLDIKQDDLLAIIMTFGPNYQLGIIEDLYKEKKNSENLEADINASWINMLDRMDKVTERLENTSTLIGHGTSLIENPAINKFMNKCVERTTSFINEIVLGNRDYFRDILIKKLQKGTELLFESDNKNSYQLLLEFFSLRHNNGYWTVWKEIDEENFLSELKKLIDAVNKSNKVNRSSFFGGYGTITRERWDTSNIVDAILRTNDLEEGEFEYDDLSLKKYVNDEDNIDDKFGEEKEESYDNFVQYILPNPNVFGFANAPLISSMNILYSRARLMKSFLDRESIETLPQEIYNNQRKLGVFNRIFKTYNFTDISQSLTLGEKNTDLDAILITRIHIAILEQGAISIYESLKYDGENRSLEIILNDPLDQQINLLKKHADYLRNNVLELLKNDAIIKEDSLSNSKFIYTLMISLEAMKQADYIGSIRTDIVDVLLEKLLILNRNEKSLALNFFMGKNDEDIGLNFNILYLATLIVLYPLDELDSIMLYLEAIRNNPESFWKFTKAELDTKETSGLFGILSKQKDIDQGAIKEFKNDIDEFRERFMDLYRVVPKAFHIKQEKAIPKIFGGVFGRGIFTKIGNDKNKEEYDILGYHKINANLRDFKIEEFKKEKPKPKKERKIIDIVDKLYDYHLRKTENEFMASDESIQSLVVKLENEKSVEEADNVMSNDIRKNLPESNIPKTKIVTDQPKILTKEERNKKLKELLKEEDNINEKLKKLKPAEFEKLKDEDLILLSDEKLNEMILEREKSLEEYKELLKEVNQFIDLLRIERLDTFESFIEEIKIAIETGDISEVRVRTRDISEKPIERLKTTDEIRNVTNTILHGLLDFAGKKELPLNNTNNIDISDYVTKMQYIKRWMSEFWRLVPNGYNFASYSINCQRLIEYDIKEFTNEFTDELLKRDDWNKFIQIIIWIGKNQNMVYSLNEKEKIITNLNNFLIRNNRYEDIPKSYILTELSSDTLKILQDAKKKYVPQSISIVYKAILSVINVPKAIVNVIIWTLDSTIGNLTRFIFTKKAKEQKEEIIKEEEIEQLNETEEDDNEEDIIKKEEESIKTDDLFEILPNTKIDEQINFLLSLKNVSVNKYEEIIINK